MQEIPSDVISNKVGVRRDNHLDFITKVPLSKTCKYNYDLQVVRQTFSYYELHLFVFYHLVKQTAVTMQINQVELRHTLIS